MSWKRALIAVSVLTLSLIVAACNVEQPTRLEGTTVDDTGGAGQKGRSGPSRAISYHTAWFIPNSDVGPNDWDVWPGNEPTHYGTIDEYTPLDNKFVHSNDTGEIDRFGFTNLPTQQGTVEVTDVSINVTFHTIMNDASVIILYVRYFIEGVEQGEHSWQFPSPQYDGTILHIKAAEFSNLSYTRNEINSIEVEIEMLTSVNGDVHVERMSVDIGYKLITPGSKNDPHEEPGGGGCCEVP